MTIFRPDIKEYLDSIAPEEDSLLQEIKKEAADLGVPSISSHEGKFLYLMAKVTGAKKVLELGTGLGYSTIWLARALPELSKLVTIEKEEQYCRLATNHFKKLDRNIIELIESEATPILEQMDDQFDFCFMDEFKAFYFIDLEHCVRLLKPGGVLITHNALEGGWVPEGQIDIESPELKKWHNQVLSHRQLKTVIVPVGEGFTLSFSSSL